MNDDTRLIENYSIVWFPMPPNVDIYNNIPIVVILDINFGYIRLKARHTSNIILYYNVCGIKATASVDSHIKRLSRLTVFLGLGQFERRLRVHLKIKRRFVKIFPKNIRHCSHTCTPPPTSRNSAPNHTGYRRRSRRLPLHENVPIILCGKNLKIRAADGCEN